MTSINDSSNIAHNYPSPSIVPPLPVSPSADEMHLALSHIVFRREYRPPSPPRETEVPSDDKHLELLNLLSLLLVTQAKGDVAAVMFRVLSKDNIELHYTKNRPCTDAEKTYINGILATVRDTTNDIHITSWKLLSLVIPNCKHKMKSRAIKIRDRLVELSKNAPFTIPDDACTTAAENSLRDAIGPDVFPTDLTTSQFVHGWLKYMMQTPNPLFTQWLAGGVYQMLHLAYSIGHTPDISDLLEPKLLRRVRKLGDYYAAALALINNAANLPADQLRDLKIVEIVPTLPRSVSVRANFVDTINAWARHTGELEVPERALRLAFPDMDPLPVSQREMQTVTVSVHCECTLLLSMITSTASTVPPVPVLLELGVSKSSCFMCREFIAAVQLRYRHFTVKVSSCHGKHVAGWSLPTFTPAALTEVMNKRLRDEMDEVLQRATRNRKSDSIPRFSGPKDGVVVPSGAQIVKTVKESGAGLFSMGQM